MKSLVLFLSISTLLLATSANAQSNGSNMSGATYSQTGSSNAWTGAKPAPVVAPAQKLIPPVAVEVIYRDREVVRYRDTVTEKFRCVTRGADGKLQSIEVDTAQGCESVLSKVAPIYKPSKAPRGRG